MKEFFVAVVILIAVAVGIATLAGWLGDSGPTGLPNGPTATVPVHTQTNTT